MGLDCADWEETVVDIVEGQHATPEQRILGIAWVVGADVALLDVRFPTLFDVVGAFELVPFGGDARCDESRRSHLEDWGGRRGDGLVVRRVTIVLFSHV